MPDLFADPGAQPLPLEDADLVLWAEPDLGADPDELLAELTADVAWRQDRITVYGKSHLQPRLTAWYGDCAYRYSGLTLEPAPWTPRLQQLRECVQALTGCEFNSVLLNYYRNEHDCMGMHSDDERELGPRPAIASLSLGAERELQLRHRARRDLKPVRLPLPPGSLLLMRGDTQRYWRHGIPRLRRPCGPRVNLTFRRIYPDA